MSSASANTAELPFAITVPVEDADAQPGQVVRYDEVSERYQLTDQPFDEAVFGIIEERPAIVLQTSSTTLPVVTSGQALVRVNDENGSIARGDLLTSSGETGEAMRAGTSTMAVFAVALEALSGNSGEILAAVGREQAQSLQRSRQALENSGENSGEEASSRLGRIAIAVTLTIGSLAFLLYSFGGILKSSVLSIGRNPRAKQALMVSSVGSMLLVLLVVAVVIFIALGVLVLPV